MKPHKFDSFIKGSSGAPFRYFCSYCGLVQLKNKASQDACKKACEAQ